MCNSTSMNFQATSFDAQMAVNEENDSSKTVPRTVLVGE